MTAWSRLVRSPVWVDAVLPTTLLRGVVLVYAVLAVIVMRPEALPGGSLLGIWERWDAPHFFEIARYGYGPPADPARIVIFPLFPALVAVGSLLPNRSWPAWRSRSPQPSLRRSASIA